MSDPLAFAAAAPHSWSPPVAQQTLVMLNQTRGEVGEAIGRLRRASVRAQHEWRGPARDDFDTRYLRLLADLHALEVALTNSAQMLTQQIAWVTANATGVPWAQKNALGMMPLFPVKAP